MKKLESSLVNMVCVLTGVAVIMGGILAFVNNVTKDSIEQQKKLATENGIKQVMADESLKVTDTDTIKTVTDGKERTYVVYHSEKGAAVESTTMGFGGDLKVLVGFDSEGNILGYTILEHQETPGLGAKADEWFQQSIKGKNPGVKPLGVTKDNKAEQEQVDAITASTITSRAFLNAVNNAYTAYKQSKQDQAEKPTETEEVKEP